MKRLLLGLCCALALGLAQATPGEVPVGGALPDLALHGLSAPNARLGAYRGKPLIINVWASWCGPCADEMGAFVQLAKRYHGKQFNLIGVSTDDYADRALGFVKRQGIPFPTYIDAHLELENLLGASQLPLTLFIDAQGRVLDKVYGYHPWDSPQSLDFIAKTLKVKL